MKNYFRFSAMASFLMIVILMSLNVAAIPAAPASKPPTATPSGPTPTPGSGGTADIVVSGTQWGVSTCNIGANEGSALFNVADLTDIGFNTYRIYGGMSRWEPNDDDGVYGSPSIAQIKANINLIPWATWDNLMTNPPNGTDYWWSDTTSVPVTAVTLFTNLKNAGIKPVVVLRNRDNNNRPAWMTANPTTAADYNEWWEHVFATVYWFNVRNSYGVDDWEIHNEPNNQSQGYGGTITDYYTFAQQTNDAIQYVYATYLPGRTPHVYSPATTSGSSWPRDVMINAGAYFTDVDIHNYDVDVTTYDQKVHDWMNQNGKPNAPLWITETGEWRQNKYDTASFANDVLIANTLRGSRPGLDYVSGSHIFSFYDWTTYQSGLIHGMTGTGTKTPGYYAMRLATRGLQGCKATYQASESQSFVEALATKDSLGKVYLIVNNASQGSKTLTADLSALITSGTGTQWQFDATHNDVITGSPVLSNGRVTFTVLGHGTVLLKF